LKPDVGNVRSLAAQVVDRALTSRRPVDRLLRQVEASLDARDRALLHELVLGTLRWLRRLDCVIEAASSRQLQAIDTALLSPLRLAIYQLLLLDRIPSHAAVHEAVAEARRRTHRGGAGFVNAVLRRVAGSPQLEAWPVEEAKPSRRLAIETSHPDLLVERWLKNLGERRTRDLLQANNRVKPRQILTFRGRGGRDRTAARLAEEGVRTSPSTVAPLGLVVTEGDPLDTPSFRDGSVYLQDVASQAAALLPPPVRSERVLDMAAAPGGKSFSLLSWEADLEVLAADRSWQRLQLLQSNRDRMGLPIRLVQADGLLPPMRAPFDRVVLDLPCTGTGTLRKNPELKWRIDSGEIQRLSQQGLEMLQAGSRLVRPGGILSMITCSLEPEENAEVVSAFLATEIDFEPLILRDEVPAPLDQWVIGDGVWQILPADVHDGFTVHVLRRRQ